MKPRTLAALVAAPIVGWIFGGLMMLGIVSLLDRFDGNLAQFDDDDDCDDDPVVTSPIVNRIASEPLQAQRLWRDAIEDYSKYDEQGYL